MTLLTRTASFLHDLDVLDSIGSATAVHVVSAQEPGRPRRAWVVRLGHDLYVRTAPGAPSTVGGRAHLQVDGARRPVTLTEVAPELHTLLDDAFLARYGETDDRAASTFRLLTRRATWAERVAAAVDAARRSRRPQRAPEPCPSC